jgi:glycine/D-amino acid oxidase-like deaminating enzyme
MHDIVIIGGGITGSSIAWHLARDGRAGRVLVVERDPSYEFATTPRSAGGVRRQFSLPENILMSDYNFEVYRGFSELMAVDGEPATVDWHNGGYLFLADDAGAAALEATVRAQHALGVTSVAVLGRDEIGARFPSFSLDDIAIGTLGAEDSWIDPHGALMGFRRKARSLGAEYIADEVVGIEAAEGRASAVRLASGATIPCGTVVVAAGAWSADVCAMAGMPLPVEPVRRQAYYFEIREKIEPLPLTIDPTGCWLRPEGAGYICGRSNPDEPAGYNFEVDYDWFDEMVWPVIAARVPAFEALKLKRAWTGLYAVNRLDENLIIGPWEGGMENLYVACGFSGHGLQQAPSVGRAMTELLLDGRFVTLDLSRLSYRRIIDNAPLPEAGIV